MNVAIEPISLLSAMSPKNLSLQQYIISRDIFCPLHYARLTKMSRQLSGLKIVTWNSIHAKKAEIDYFLAQHNVYIMQLSENLLKSSEKFKFVY